ncbi:MAG: PadR family transcriptional regulator [Chitinophagaceae bacterium]|nr:PadR family transcriptional regulator [Anaerolineae bacterium]
MKEKAARELTALEYIVLGLISFQPQSGYSIVTYFEAGTSSWSASPGSIYPILKRLEKQAIVEGELETEHETRPRKIYRLSPHGEKLLDGWLNEVPTLRPFYEQRELAMWRFQFMEKRLNVHQILKWLDNYMDNVRYADAINAVYNSGIIQAWEELGEGSVHRQLAMEAYVMELNAIRTWIEMAQMRLKMIAHRTGEFKTIDPSSGSSR